MAAGPLARGDVLVEETLGEVLAFDPATSYVHVLDSGAAALLMLCDGGHSIQAMAAEVHAATDQPVSVDAIRQAVDALVRLGLVYPYEMP